MVVAIEEETAVEDAAKMLPLARKSNYLKYLPAIYSESDFGAPWRQSIFHVDEALPGKGLLDYDTILRRLDGLSGNPLLIIEHIQDDDETILVKHYIEYVARKNGVKLG